MDENIMYLLNFPWDTRSEDEKSIKTIQDRIRNVHIGHNEAVNLCLSYISYYFLHKSFPPYTLCLCGPYGSGKTNLISSIAKSMGRKFIEIDALSLDIHHLDEPLFLDNSIYSAIFKLIHETGTMNPVIEIKNIDRLKKFSIIHQFIDLLHRLNQKEYKSGDIPLNLSDIFFIFSIEDDSDLSHVLRKEMDFVYLNGFSKIEKSQIIKDIIVPKKLNKWNIDKKDLKFSASAIKAILENYDPHYEHIYISEKIIDSIFNKCSFIIRTKQDNKAIVISNKTIHQYLDNEKYEVLEKPQFLNRLGVCLVIDENIKYVEILGLKTEDKVDALNIIGQNELDTITKESFELAFTLAKNIYHEIIPKRESSWEFHVNIDTDCISQKDFHENTVGITLAFLSYYLEKKIPNGCIYMGEVSLNGKLLPVKNLEQKLRIAKDEGFQHIFIPGDNVKEFKCIPEELKENVTIYFVNWILDIAAVLFTGKHF